MPDQRTQEQTTESRPERKGRALESVVGTLRLAWSAAPQQMLFVVTVSVVLALVPPVVVWLGKRLVDLVAEAAERPVSMSEAWPIIISLGILAGGQRALNRLESTRQWLFAERVRMIAERRFLEQVARMDLGHFDNSDWHDRVARAKRDLRTRPMNLTWTVIGFGSSAITIVGMMGVLLVLDPILVVLAVVSLIPSLVIQRRVTRERYAFHFRKTPEARERDYLGELLSLPRYAKEIRSYTLSEHFLSRHREIDEELYAGMRTLYRKVDRTVLIVGLISGVALATAYAFVASGGIRGELTPGDVTALTGAFVSMNVQALSLIMSYVRLDEDAQFLRDYFDFLAIDPVVEVREQPRVLEEPSRGGIVFDDVHFAYPGGEREALRGVSLHVRPGELVALVGDNGAGKTTLVKLLLRFYDPQQGAIRIGGVDIREVHPDHLRARIGVLFQDFAQYELSVRENVTLGRADRESNDLIVEDALRAARAEWLARRLNGLDAKVGRQFEGGHDLSGGEWQRLALARLLYRDADIWILDEPTSSLDPEAEAGIFAELRENLHGRMGIVISHRFSTVRIADRIAVVQDGRITELGTHAELLALRGRYAHLFELQAAGYR